MVRSLGFGSNPVHLFALFRLAFTAHPSNDLCLRTKLTRWIVLQKARRHRINLLRLLVGTQFQVLFHSPPGVLFTFPSRYSFTIDHVIYLALEGGPSRFRQDFSCPALLKKPYFSLLRVRYSAIAVSTHKVSLVFVYTAFTFSG